MLKASRARRPGALPSETSPPSRLEVRGDRRLRAGFGGVSARRSRSILTQKPDRPSCVAQGAALRRGKFYIVRWMPLPRQPSAVRPRGRAADGRTALKGPLGMKVTIDIDCTPAEARHFLGLPDLEPIQNAVMGRMQEKMLSEIDRFSPEALMKQWLTVFPQQAERMQEMFAGMFGRSFGQSNQ